MKKGIMKLVLILVFCILFCLLITIASAEYKKVNGSCSATITNITSSSGKLYIKMEFVNRSSSAEAFSYTFSVSVFQNGYECDSDYSGSSNTMDNIKDGAKLTVVKAYKLKNEQSLVEVDLDEWIAWDKKPVTVFFNPVTQVWGSKTEAQNSQKKTSETKTSQNKTSTEKKNEWICPNCGNHNTSAFCPECGTSKPTPTPSPTPIPSPTPSPSPTPVPDDIQARIVPVAKMEYSIKFKDGSVRNGEYTGETLDGLPQGFGVFVSHNSAGLEWHYIGSWDKGMFSGDGAQYWESNQVHKGVYKENTLSTGVAIGHMRLKTIWYNKYDVNGNQYLVSYFPGTERKYLEGYYNWKTNTFAKKQFYDIKGNEIEEAAHIDGMEVFSHIK